MKRSRMRELTVEVTVGVVIFMILLALGIFTIILSRENIFKTYYPIQAKFRTVAGLAEGDNVLFHGVKIGVVRSLEITPDGVLVKASMEYPVEFRKDYQIRIDSSSVLGGHYLSIHEGSTDQPPVSRDIVFDGQEPVSLIDDAARTFNMIKKSLQEGGILKNLEVSMDNIKDVSAELKVVVGQLAKGEGTLGKLFMEDGLYKKLDSITVNLETISADLAQGKGTIGKLLADDELYDQVMAVVADLKDVSGKLAAGEGTVGKLLADDSLYTQISALSSNLVIVTDRLVAGEGTLGKLSKDDALYNEVKTLVEEAIATLDDLRETTPITSFATIFFGAF